MTRIDNGSRGLMIDDGGGECVVKNTSTDRTDILGHSQSRNRKPPLQQRKAKVLSLLSDHLGPVSWQALKAARADYQALHDLIAEGTALYPTQGVFALARDYEAMPFALSVLSVHGAEYTLCLTSAAYYHGLLPEPDEYLWMVLPSNRNTLREICGFQPVPVRWSAMRLPSTAVHVPRDDCDSMGESISTVEATERYYGVFRESIYGSDVKITSPARTVCDLLMFMGKPIGRVWLNGLAISETVAYDALREYCQNSDLSEARRMAQRLGHGDEVDKYLHFADRLTVARFG